MHAVIDPTAGYNEAKSLTIEQIPDYTDFVQYGRSIDNGHTKTNALYWASTRTASSGGSTPTATTTTLTVSPNSSAAAGATVTLTATVSPSAAAGSVTFKDGTTTIATITVSGGTASTATSSLATGSHSLSAVFTASNPAIYGNSTSSTTSYTITSSGGGSGSSGTNGNAVRYMAYSFGQPVTVVRVAVNDTNYTVTTKDTIIAMTAISAGRTVTLPSVASIPKGWQIAIKDESGACSGGNTIIVAGTIDGQQNIMLSTAYSTVSLYSNGTSWSRI